MTRLLESIVHWYANSTSHHPPTRVCFLFLLLQAKHSLAASHWPPLRRFLFWVWVDHEEKSPCLRGPRNIITRSVQPFIFAEILISPFTEHGNSGQGGCVIFERIYYFMMQKPGWREGGGTGGLLTTSHPISTRVFVASALAGKQ